MKKDIKELIREAVDVLYNATDEELYNSTNQKDIEDILRRRSYMGMARDIKRCVKIWQQDNGIDAIPIVYISNSLKDSSNHGRKDLAMFSSEDDIYKRLREIEYTDNVNNLSWQLLSTKIAKDSLKRLENANRKTEKQMSLFLKGDK